MTERVFRQGDMILRTGAALPHLGVFTGQVYEVEDFERHHSEGLTVRGVLESLDPAGFVPYEPEA